MSGGDAAWANDVTQDVFVRLLEKAPRLDQQSPLLGWLLTVANRLCLDKLRHERTLWARVWQTLSDTAETEASDPNVAHQEEVLLARLKQSLTALPAKEQVAMVMKYVEGEPQTAIAEALQCSEGYVSRLLARAASRLGELGWDVDDV
jgi:RNA polymerase sigma-70 factor, ECF subfamily